MNSPSRLFALTASVSLLIATTANAATEPPGKAEIGSKVAGFTAQDYLGREYSLGEIESDKIVVLAFLGTECPLAKLYAPQLAKLHEQFEPQGVVFLGVDSNRQDSITEIASFARVHAVPFPILKDLKQVMADRVGVTRTPEVVVLDTERKIRYRGRIDDQFGFIADAQNANYQKPEPDRRDLAGALTELLAGKPVSRPSTEPYGCLIGRDREADPNSAVTYCSQIVRILNHNCVFCHREGQIAPFSLTEYEEVAGWADMIDEVVQAERMPPWHADGKFGHFNNDARLSQQDKDLIHQWVVAGAPQGDPAELPEPPQFVEGWMIPEPDEILYMADEPYEVPAHGVVEYQHFVVDPGWTEDKWISAIEPKPGNPSVVHHILIFVLPPGGTDLSIGGDNVFVGAFAPGLRPEPLPTGMARYVEAGSKLIFQLHYTPNGSPQTDRSYAGIVFAEPQTVKKEVIVSSAINGVFEIPPHERDFQVAARYVFTRDSLLLTMMPHMHLRGKSFRYDAVYPDGQREVLLSVPRYDFGWQTNYRLAEPKLMPQGTRLECLALFDNSEENLNNPDPTVAVRFGDQTWDEMMIGFFEAAPAEQDLTDAERRNRHELSRAEQFQVILQATGGEPDDNLKVGTYLALKDDNWIDQFTEILQMMAPQVDRVCASGVESGKLKQFRGPRPPQPREQGQAPPVTLDSPLPGVNAENESLAGYAAKPAPTVHPDLTKLENGVLATMAGRGARSSLHVPVELRGRRLTVNFWSRDKNAFPQSAVQFLTAVAHGMVEAASKQQTASAAAQ